MDCIIIYVYVYIKVYMFLSHILNKFQLDFMLEPLTFVSECKTQ